MLLVTVPAARRGVVLDLRPEGGPTPVPVGLVRVRRGSSSVDVDGLSADGIDLFDLLSF
jgi:hypothetical protein